MSQSQEFILGEFSCRMDPRYRLSLPDGFFNALTKKSTRCMLAKERPGCISLWSMEAWQTTVNDRVELIKQMMRLGDLSKEIDRVQLLGRLLSTRDTPVEFRSGKRLVVPQAFREFLGVKPGGDVMVVGAAVSVELWNPTAWSGYLERQMPKFRRLCKHLSTPK